MTYLFANEWEPAIGKHLLKRFRWLYDFNLELSLTDKTTNARTLTASHYKDMLHFRNHQSYEVAHYYRILAAAVTHENLSIEVTAECFYHSERVVNLLRKRPLLPFQ